MERIVCITDAASEVLVDYCNLEEWTQELREWYANASPGDEYHFCLYKQNLVPRIEIHWRRQANGILWIDYELDTEVPLRLGIAILRISRIWRDLGLAL